jgi:hypothetical protein
MATYCSYKKTLLFLTLSLALLALPGCSPKIKIGLWAKNNKAGASALEGWATDSPGEAALLLTLDCTDRKAFKKKITDALNTAPAGQIAQEGYGSRQRGYPYGNDHSRNQGDGFGDWCRNYPKAAKRLRSHAKALCKTGIGILNGSIK